MKKIVVISDSHGDKKIYEYIRIHEKDADYFVHCGDSEVMDVNELNDYIAVKGNNDWHLNLPDFVTLRIEDLNVFITHGHRFSFFHRDLAMKDALNQKQCQVLLCGHTHVPMFEHDGNQYFINPGSTSLPRGGSVRSYAVVTIDGRELSCEFKQF